VRVESHTVLGEDGVTRPDWIWMDVIDQVNIMAYILPRPPLQMRASHLIVRKAEAEGSHMQDGDEGDSDVNAGRGDGGAGDYDADGVDRTTAAWNKYRGGHFAVFRQRKYGINKESLATAGGHIEMNKGETPLDAAKREVRRVCK
jgi:hypothetical protein